MNKTKNRFHRLYPVSFALAFVLGCATTPQPADQAAQRRMLTMLMPSRIEIVEPFTRIKSFDDDSVPDGIELLLQAVNSLGNPGLMIVGRIHVELYEYVPASVDHKGKQLEIWQIELSTSTHQRTYWNQLTQMYEFRLGVDPARMSAKGRYVLAVTYNSPLGDHLTDECVAEYRAVAAPLGAAGRVP